MYRAILLALVSLVASCGPDPAPAVFPIAYAQTYQEVRDCRFSLDHDLERIRVLASPEALTPYLQHTPFPAGAIVLKEQFEESDMTCSGPILSITAMKKLEVGSSPDTLDWRWQEVGPDLLEQEYDEKRCVSCHRRCGTVAAGGFDGTCTMP
jgi:hypothetical protein